MVVKETIILKRRSLSLFFSRKEIHKKNVWKTETTIVITWIKKILWYFLVLRKKLRRLSLFIGKRAYEHKWVDKWVDKKTDHIKIIEWRTWLPFLLNYLINILLFFPRDCICPVKSERVSYYNYNLYELMSSFGS